jgi:hypothetical protein
MHPCLAALQLGVVNHDRIKVINGTSMHPCLAALQLGVVNHDRIKVNANYAKTHTPWQLPDGSGKSVWSQFPCVWINADSKATPIDLALNPKP